MNGYLLDTCAWLWSILSSDKLPPEVTAILRDEKNDIWIHQVTYLEVQLKHAKGKLNLPAASTKEFIQIVEEKMGYKFIPLTNDTIFELNDLPEIHRDPFDRLIVACAKKNKLVLISPDHMLQKYPIPVFWK